jgi:hypothetical protein
MANIKIFSTKVDGRELTWREQDFIREWAEASLFRCWKSKQNPITLGPAFGKTWKVFKDGLIVSHGST